MRDALRFVSYEADDLLLDHVLVLCPHVPDLLNLINLGIDP